MAIPDVEISAVRLVEMLLEFISQMVMVQKVGNFRG